MLTIKNFDKINRYEFSNKGSEWIVYGIEEQKYQYQLIFIPKDLMSRTYDISKAQSVYLTRNTLWGTKDSYKIESGIGATYINRGDVNAMFNLIMHICREELIK